MPNDKKPGYDFMHRVRLGKGQCFANEARTGLPQGVIPTFHMIDLPTSFANTFVCLIRKDELIGFPEIAVTVAGLVCWWNLLPQPALVPSFINK